MVRFAAIPVLLLLTSSCLADIQIVALPDTESSSFDGTASLAEVADVTAPTFPDFSSLGETEFCLKIEAPAGSLFHAAYQESGVFTAEQRSAGMYVNGGAFVDLSPSISLTGYSGTPGPLAFSGTVSLSGPGGTAGFIEAFAFPSAGDEFSFKSVSICTTVPASYTTDFTSAAIEFSGIRGGIMTTSDYGQFVSLTAIPEPSAFALLLLIAAGRVWLTRGWGSSFTAK